MPDVPALFTFSTLLRREDAISSAAFLFNWFKSGGRFTYMQSREQRKA